MQVVKIVPKVRTMGRGIFDYSIPPEILSDIKIGLLVLVPFHGRQIEGIIIDIKRSSKIEKLKPIIKIIDLVPVVDNIHIKLAGWMSDYYLAPFGQTLFENIVPPAIRTIDKQLNIDLIRGDAKNINSSKKFLIVGDYNFRFSFYRQAIEKILARKKSVIILVPDISEIKYFAQSFPNIISLHADMTKTKRWENWHKIRMNKSQIIIGSQSALFAPVTDLGLIIIDQEENETYKNDRSPRFHSVDVAFELTKLTGANLVLGSLTPRLETYFRAKKNEMRLISQKSKQSSISIVNTSSIFNAISPTLEIKITDYLNQNKKILLVLNRKGEGTKYACMDCYWTYNCPKCNLPLTPQEDMAKCFHCQKGYKLPATCPKCQSPKLKNVGLGTRRLESIIKKIWPNKRIIRLEKDAVISQFDLAIATSFALKTKLPKIGLVAIIDADQSLNLPDFRAEEKSFETFFKFLKIGEEGIIQTKMPDSSYISHLARLDFYGFYHEELKNREASHFPPFMHLTRLLSQNPDKEQARGIIENVASQLKKLSPLEIIGPSPAFYQNKLGKFRYQLLLKYTSRSSEINNYLSKLSNIIIDVDPVDLL